MSLFLCFIITLLLGLGLLGHYACIYLPLLRSKQDADSPSSDQQEGISVLLYTSNQLDPLRNCLSVLLSQDYPAYQVIVIDDGSTDGTYEWIQQQLSECERLHYTFVPENTRLPNHRQLAFMLGAKAAKHDILLFTEATCYPLTDQWLNEMAKQYASPQTEVVIGYCRYPEKAGYLQRRIAFDNLKQGFRLLAAAKAGHPYAADGRNLSYRKPLFFQQKEGFLSQLVRQSGEQARFVRQVAHRHNTSALYTPQSQTEMEPIADQAAWKKFRQLRFEAEHLHGLLPTLYACESVSFLLFHLAAIATCLLAIPAHQIGFALCALSLLLLRLLLGTQLLRKLSLRLGQPISRRWIPWLEWTQSASDIRLLFTQSLPFQRKRQ